MNEGETSLEGSAIAALSDKQLQELVRTTSVFARIRPQDKLRIVKALQANGEITAMIGDGVNDAPALQRANIGVVVGSATDVAKETADLILLDNNFRTIVAAIEEGRIIFQNIRKVVAYTLSNSFAEVLTIFIAMVLRLASPADRGPDTVDPPDLRWTIGYRAWFRTQGARYHGRETEIAQGADP